MLVCIGGTPHTVWAYDGGLVLDPSGYLVAGRDILDPALNGGRAVWSLDRDPYPLETSQPGLFAVGDVRDGSTKRLSAAVGEGGCSAAPVAMRITRDGTIRFG